MQLDLMGLDLIVVLKKIKLIFEINIACYGIFSVSTDWLPKSIKNLGVRRRELSATGYGNQIRI